MKQITLSEYEKIGNDFKGIWTTERDDLPDWPEVRHKYIGKRTMMAGDGSCTLLIEGLSFEIIDDSQTPKHTPGPWESCSSGCCMVVYGKDTIGADRRIAEMIGPDELANAHLIAAAPTLLTMLQRLLDGVLMLPELPKTIAPLDIEQARAAIAKATGH